MAELILKTPGFSQIETDSTAPVKETPLGVPAGVIGTSQKGPAFIPITVASQAGFTQVFGNLDVKKPAPYAANEFLQYRNALTFIRILGAGSNETTTDIANTEQTGRVKNAGFVVKGGPVLSGTAGTPTDFRHSGSVQFLTAKHIVKNEEVFGMPMFSDNNSLSINSGGDGCYLVRAAMLVATDARMMILDGNQAINSGTFAPAISPLLPTPDDVATLSGGYFKLAISSSVPSYASTDGVPGVKVFTASLNPSDSNYVGKILNTDPTKFAQEKHLLYMDFAVDDELASPSTGADEIAILSGSDNYLSMGSTGSVYRDAFGMFNTRYTTPKTTWFISQPFGMSEYDLFYFETLDDGAVSAKYKISIGNLKASTNDAYEYGSFTVMIRAFDDTDINPQIIEEYPNVSLDPQADNYIAKVIGNIKYSYNFDSDVESERRITRSGLFTNKSSVVRIVMHDDVEKGILPKKCLPFGFRGLEVLKTNTQLNAMGWISDLAPASISKRIDGLSTGTIDPRLLGSILPPVPLRFKVTHGEVNTSPPAAHAYTGYPGLQEVTDARYYWGIKFERNNAPLNPNVTQEKNSYVEQIIKFAGLKKLGLTTTGSEADRFNDNKFTLAKVALSNTDIAQITSSAATHMLEAAYLRDGIPSTTNYSIRDAGPTVPINRITFATLYASGGATLFNKFSNFTKYTNVFYGGFDGVNILDKDAALMGDKATSTESGGCADVSYVSPGFTINQAGTGSTNSAVMSYKAAIRIVTDPMMAVNKNVSTPNIFGIPGVRDQNITDYAMEMNDDYGLALYVMDIPSYDDNFNRIFDSDSSSKPNINNTCDQFDTRNIDSNPSTTYYPDVMIEDTFNKKRVTVPASVAGLSAIAYNDFVAYPWYVPAGTNRASLAFVKRPAVKINVRSQERLTDSRINPIIKIPNMGYVIYGQQDLQKNKSALDRINVRRMVFEVKRIVRDAAQTFIFEQANANTRARFVAQVRPKLSTIQQNNGLSDFSIICDARNNSSKDEENLLMNASISLTPVGSIEKIIFNFILTNNTVQFA